MKDCLEAHREDPGFSAECKEEFEAMMEARAADFRCVVCVLRCATSDVCQKAVLVQNVCTRITVSECTQT